MKHYIFDGRANFTIEIKAETETDARAEANRILQQLEMVDHHRDDTLDLDLEDGLQLMEVLG